MTEDRGEIRIGVFVCHCGTNIAGFLDTAAIADYARHLPGVVFVKENQYSCSESGTLEIKNSIQEHGLNRVVVAACTPRTHEPLFRRACQEAGLNPFLFEFVNIREHCSWVHMKEREAATKKAQDLIRMGVARAALLEPKEEIVAGVLPTALVIGGGISGLTAAKALASRGFKVWLIEQEGRLGGILNSLYRLYPTQRLAQEVLEEKSREVLDDPHITVYTSTRVSNIKGYIGNYSVTLQRQGGQEELQVGVIIVATGADIWEPEPGLYGYGDPRVITQLGLEKRLAKEDLSGLNCVVMIQCVGAMSQERVYCSKICCLTAIKNAILLKERNPNSQIYILYRDIQTYGTTYEDYLRKARQLGIRFINYHPSRPPEVKDSIVQVYHQLLGREFELVADLIVLATPLVARSGIERLSQMLKVPLDQDKFFLEAHVKLNPVDFATDGIYICGTAHWPKDTTESIAQALAAAARASIPLTREQVKVEPITSSLIDEDACRGCGLCASLCPYGAIELVETEKGMKARMIEVACKGCGVCGATCYVKAIGMNHYTNEQIEAQIAAFAQRD